MSHIILNGASHPLERESISIQDLVDQLKLNATGIIAEHNGELIRSDQFSLHTLRSGDILELIQFMGGG